MRHLWISIPLLLAACKDGGDDPGDTDTEGPTGCFTVNGAGGHASLSQAIGAAADGDSVELCEDITEALVIEKSITLIGNGATWDAPVNEPAITVASTASVTVEGISFTSTRSGIVVEGGSLTVRDSDFSAMGNFGIDAEGGTVAVQNVLFELGQEGGIRVEGGDLTVVGATFTDTTGAGITLDDGATASISGSTFTGTVPKSSDDIESGGWAVLASDSTVALAENTFSANAYGDVRVDGTLASLTMNGDVSDGAQIGVWLGAASATLTDVSFTNYLQYGLVDEGGATLDLVGATFSTTHEGSAPAQNTDYNEDFSGSFALVVFGADLTITGGTFSGHNGGGIWQNAGTNVDGVRLDVDGATITDNARFGVVTYGGTMVLNDVTVSETLDDEATCCDDSGCWCDMAVAAWQSELTWTGGTLSGNGTFGLTALAGSADLVGVTLSDNDVYGAYVQDSLFSCDGCTFDQGRQYGLYMSGSTGVLEGTTFSNAAYTSEYEYEDTETGDTIKSVTHYQAQDVFAYQSALEITNGTFSNGEGGVTAYYTSQLTVTDTTFDGYNSEAVYGYYDSNVDVKRTSFTNIGNNPLYCYYNASLVADQVTIENVTEYTYWYESYRNGELEWESKSTSPGTALYGYLCTAVLEDVTIEGVWSRAIYAGDSSIEMDGVSIRDVASQGYSWDAAVYAYYSSVAPDMVLNDVTITDVHQGYGLYVSGSSSAPGGFVEMVGTTIGDDAGEGVASTGIYLSQLDQVTVQDFGIYGAGADAIVTSNTTATITDGVIHAPAGYGINASAGSLTVSRVTIDGATQSGMVLTGGTHSVTDATVTAAAAYGVECDGAAEWNGCDANTLDGALGETTGCGCDE